MKMKKTILLTSVVVLSAFTAQVSADEFNTTNAVPDYYPVQEAKPEVTGINGTPLIQDEKPEVTEISGTPLVQAEKPAIEVPVYTLNFSTPTTSGTTTTEALDTTAAETTFRNYVNESGLGDLEWSYDDATKVFTATSNEVVTTAKGTSLVQDEKPEVTSISGTPLVQDEKPAILPVDETADKAKGTSLVQDEKPEISNLFLQDLDLKPSNQSEATNVTTTSLNEALSKEAKPNYSRVEARHQGLPETGEKESLLGLAGVGVLGLFGLAATSKKKFN